MNSEKVQTIISELINEYQSNIRYARQYAPAKHQIATLTALGILELMPAKFGHGDAKIVIEAAQRGETTVMNSFGEGVEVGASALYLAINEVETVEEPEFVEIKTFKPNLKSHLATLIREEEIIRGEIARGKATQDTYQALILTQSKIRQLKAQVG